MTKIYEIFCSEFPKMSEVSVPIPDVSVEVSEIAVKTAEKTILKITPRDMLFEKGYKNKIFGCSKNIYDAVFSIMTSVQNLT